MTPPIALVAAAATVARHEGVGVSGPWTCGPTPHGDAWLLPLRLALDAPPTPHIPAQTSWVVAVSTVGTGTPRVRVYPAASGPAITATFPHQSHNRPPQRRHAVRGGDLCTRSSTHGLAARRLVETSEPRDLRDRVVWHVARAQAWTEAAALGQLAQNGDPFELPDVQTSGRADLSSLAFHEPPGGHGRWRSAPRAGLVRTAEIGPPSARAVVALEWLGPDGAPVISPPWGFHISGLDDADRALSVRLDRAPALDPWQAPRTGAELRDAMRDQGIDPRALLDPLWRHLRGSRRPLLVVGFPIPDVVGGADSVMHWQAIRLPATPAQAPNTRRLRDGQDYARAFGPRTLHWIPMSENWHPAVLQNRGRLPDSLASARVVVAGGGALGAPVTDALVRQGDGDVLLADPDRLEAGNLVRHALSLVHLHRNKAAALADHLNAANPSARVRGVPVALPSNRPEVNEAIASADLLLDLTASDDLLHAVPTLGLRPGARVVSASLGLHAERLYLYADDAGAFDPAAFDAWFAPHRAREHAAAAREGLPQAAGCWHPVTPVPGHRIQTFVGLLVDALVSLTATQGRTLAVIEWPGLSVARSHAA